MVLVLIALTVLVVGLGVGEVAYVNRSANALTQGINALEMRVEFNDMQGASRRLKDLEHQWKYIRNYWGLFMNHSEIDALTISLQRVNGFLKAGDRKGLIMEITSMKALVQHIPETQRVSLSTIL